MHKDLRELLHSAEGRSRHVVVIFLDVRGFSSFAKIAESSDAAEFLRSVYTQILDDYFPEPEFFKLTGDGMLILYRYNRDTLTDVTNQAVETSLRLVKEFSTLCDTDPMVNFDVPGELGIGVARGAATALISGDKILDYSGRPLNLAARLMDLARPAGEYLTTGFESNCCVRS
jgi:class 3 adenylate cyclase